MICTRFYDNTYWWHYFKSSPVAIFSSPTYIIPTITSFLTQGTGKYEYLIHSNRRQTPLPKLKFTAQLFSTYNVLSDIFCSHKLIYFCNKNHIIRAPWICISIYRYNQHSMFSPQFCTFSSPEQFQFHVWVYYKWRSISVLLCSQLQDYP